MSEIVNDSVRSLWVNNRQRQGQIEKHPVLITGKERRKTEKKGKRFLLQCLKGELIIMGSESDEYRGLWNPLIQSLNVCSFIMPERLKYSSLFRSYGQPNQLYIRIYYKLFVSGFGGRVDLSMEKENRTPSVLQKQRTLQNEKSEGNCLNITFLVGYRNR